MQVRSLELAPAWPDRGAWTAYDLAFIDAFPRIEALTVRGRRSPRALRAVLDAPIAGRLAELSICASAATPPEVDLLIDRLCGALPRLTSLSLGHSDLSAGRAGALVRAEGAASLTSLGLDDNPLGLPGAHALAEAPALAGLRRLFARRTQIGAEGLRALLRSPHLANLERLFVDTPKGRVEVEMMKRRFGAC